MKTQLDMDKIAKGLGAERRGKVSATGGYFGAMQLLADVEARFRVPAGGGRPTDPAVDRAAARTARAANARASRGDHGQGAGARRRERRTDAARGACSSRRRRGAERGRSRRLVRPKRRAGR